MAPLQQSSQCSCSRNISGATGTTQVPSKINTLNCLRPTGASGRAKPSQEEPRQDRSPPWMLWPDPKLLHTLSWDRPKLLEEQEGPWEDKPQQLWHKITESCEFNTGRKIISSFETDDSLVKKKKNPKWKKKKKEKRREGSAESCSIQAPSTPAQALLCQGQARPSPAPQLSQLTPRSHTASPVWNKYETLHPWLGVPSWSQVRSWGQAELGGWAPPVWKMGLGGQCSELSVVPQG